MHRRARSILRGEQGLSMILVLCIGALFAALSIFVILKAGDKADMGGEKHGADAVHAPEPAAPAAPVAPASAQ